MKTIQGFVSNQGYINNTRGQVSEFYEISPLALTYSKNRNEYRNTIMPDAVLHVFAAKDHTNDIDYILSTNDVSNILRAVQSSQEYCSGQALNFNSGRFIAYMLAYSADFMVSFNHGTFRSGKAPEWISWVTTGGDEIRIWLCSVAFESQYANYDITVVPPLSDLDDFFGNYATISTMLKARTLGQFMTDVQDAKGNIPESYARSLTSKFYNKNTLTQPTPQYTEVDWGVLIYGAAGDNIDNIKDAIATYLLENSSHTDEEWQEILPDIFKRTEFVIYPRWDKLSIENSTIASALYSSIYNPVEMLDFVKGKVTDDRPENDIASRLEVIPFDYKAITCAVLPGLTNATDKQSIGALFKDYLPLSTMELDFNRSSIHTRDWVVAIVAMLALAEAATEFSTVQSPFRRVKRSGKVYLSFLYGEINYLVYARSNG